MVKFLDVTLKILKVTNSDIVVNRNVNIWQVQIERATNLVSKGGIFGSIVFRDTNNAKFSGSYLVGEETDTFSGMFTQNINNLFDVDSIYKVPLVTNGYGIINYYGDTCYFNDSLDTCVRNTDCSSGEKCINNKCIRYGGWVTLNISKLY